MLRFLCQSSLAIHLVLTNDAVHERMTNVMDFSTDRLTNLANTCQVLWGLRVESILQNSLSTQLSYWSGVRVPNG